MNDENDNAGSDLERDEPLFFVMNFIGATQGVWIVKGDLGCPEIDAVFRKILPASPFIVFETQASALSCILTCVHTHVNTGHLFPISRYFTRTARKQLGLVTPEAAVALT